MATICITGGTGLIGKALTHYLIAKGHAIIVLSRAEKNSLHNSITYRQWNPEKGMIDEAAISAADYIVHLAGAGVADKRWSKKRKEEIKQSRVQSSALLVDALTRIPNKVQAVISASGIGWYGPDKGTAFTETDQHSNDFLGTTCFEWESSIEPVTQLGIRLVKLRTGIVLSNEGAAFTEFKRPIQFGFATILGSGKQIISWVHVLDLVRMYEYAIENKQLAGVFNAAAPNPVSNQELIVAIAKKIKGNAFITIPVPAFALKLVLGEMSIEVLKSTYVSADKIRQNGFSFLYPTIDAALNELIA
ncbi:TIGR01777 family protein [Lacibacter luteus]|uniref:TIGR01777 family protein n=1 Tax=Lacibacter luteus TaxID=2508719 RepID=A0A4Q1CND2_9BACT|nr:TIGR01777 family oxidoreductase [Lacibacter luteus]RXK62586.1 TIGR01777 family protein [Lacibacter luteus]